MICAECQELISEYIDGGLELGEQSNVERHLADCEPCRAVRDDFLQIVHFSQQLPVQSPSRSLWPRISADLAEIEPGFWKRTLGRLAGYQTLKFNFSVPQLIAGAAALAIIISTGVIISRRDNRPAQVAGVSAVAPSDVTPLSQADLQQLEKQISQLSAAVEQRKESWDPELRTAFERNLLYIDQSLVECRHQLKDNPADNVSQELMLNAYREKVRLLEGFEKF